ncbi:MAG: hypothetical protein KKB37_02210 [Alphaproteobacteria bacterium]|nr:hypothetical protein [Alphaproteobacteria bacterium]
MEALYYLFAAALIVVAFQAAIAIWSPRIIWLRISAVAITALFIPLAYVTLTLLLSRPKPVDFAWFERNADKAAILGVSLDEGRAIYLWLRVDGDTMPGYYVLPWRQAQAEQLEDTLHAAVRSRSQVVLRQPFARKSLQEQGALSIEIIPPPSLPNKPPQIPPQIFNPRSQDI